MAIEIHELAKRIVPVLKHRGVVEASVFGSIARGDASPLSDLDLLVKYRDDVRLLDVVGLKNELESISIKAIQNYTLGLSKADFMVFI